MESILIVEHSYMMRLFLINYFSQNFDVKAVETPSEAIELLQKKSRPAAVISNFHSDKSIERTAFQEMIKLLEHNAIPSMVITDHDKSEQRIEALRMGAKDSVSKPFNPVELQLRIMSTIGYKHIDKMKKVA